MLHCPLTNFEIQKYCQSEPKFNGVYSRNNWAKLKDGKYVMNLDNYESVGIHGIALYVIGNNGSAFCNATYFNGLEVEYIPKEIQKIIENKNVITNILKNRSIRLNNVCIILYWIYLFRVKR